MIIGKIVHTDQRAFRGAVAQAMETLDPWIWLAELVANAGQSGACEINIQIENAEGDKTRIEVCDDGHGVLDPDILGKYGTSAWSDLHAQNMKPSGCGLAKLARIGVTLHGAVNRIVLSPAVLHGEEQPEVIRCPRHSQRDGTTAEVSVSHDVGNEASITPIAHAMARKATLAKLYVNGKPAIGHWSV